MVRLSQLKRHQLATITAIAPAAQNQATDLQEDSIGKRLATLGFIPGERVKVLALGLFGADPVLVQIGFTRFALRRTEADRIQVEVTA